MTEDFEERLRAYAEKARKWRMAGDHHKGSGADFPLIGKCFDNAYVLHRMLFSEGLSPFMVEGTTDRVIDAIIQPGEELDDFERVEEVAGHVHYWIEVEGPEGRKWTVDIASDTHDRLGEIVVEPCREPDGYRHLENSIKMGEKAFNNARERGDRCRYCGDHRYTPGGCPDCQDDISPDLEA